MLSPHTIISIDVGAIHLGICVAIDQRVVHWEVKAFASTMKELSVPKLVELFGAHMCALFDKYSPNVVLCERQLPVARRNYMLMLMVQLLCQARSTWCSGGSSVPCVLIESAHKFNMSPNCAVPFDVPNLSNMKLASEVRVEHILAHHKTSSQYIFVPGKWVAFYHNILDAKRDDAADSFLQLFWYVQSKTHALSSTDSANYGVNGILPGRGGSAGIQTQSRQRDAAIGEQKTKEKGHICSESERYEECRTARKRRRNATDARRKAKHAKPMLVV